MQNGRGIKRIPLSRATNLPWLKAPAGYVLVMEDVEYGNRFIIVRLQEVNKRALARAAAFPFETELFLVFSAEDATELALELHDRFAASGDLNEWFDLDQAQIAQLRNFGRPSLRDLALNEEGGQSLVEQARVVSTRPEAPPAPARAAPTRPQRRWPAWLLLLAIVTLGASILANAPQVRRLLSGQISLSEMLANRNAGATNTPDLAPSRVRSAARSTPSPAAAVGAGEVFYVSIRANARVCASRDCRAVAILEAGTRIVALAYSNGQAVDGDIIWIKFRYGGQNLFIHRSVLSQTRPVASGPRQQSATATNTVAPSATAMPSRTPIPTDTAAPSRTPIPTNTAASSVRQFRPTPLRSHIQLSRSRRQHLLTHASQARPRRTRVCRLQQRH